MITASIIRAIIAASQKTSFYIVLFAVITSYFIDRLESGTHFKDESDILEVSDLTNKKF
jgi:hypothetical protein